MNTVDKLNNTLGYLTAMSFDKPELSNELVEPLNTLSEAISEVENVSLSDVVSSSDLIVVELADEEIKIITRQELEQWQQSAIEFDGFEVWIVRGRLVK